MDRLLGVSFHESRQSLQIWVTLKVWFVADEPLNEMIKTQHSNNCKWFESEYYLPTKKKKLRFVFINLYPILLDGMTLAYPTMYYIKNAPSFNVIGLGYSKIKIYKRFSPKCRILRAYAALMEFEKNYWILM